MREETLRNRQLAIFETEDHCLEVEHRKTLSGKLQFVSTFNGKITKICTKYATIKKEVTRLVKKYDLVLESYDVDEETDIEDL